MVAPLPVFLYSLVFPFVWSYFFYGFLTPRYQFKSFIYSIIVLLIANGLVGFIFYYEYLIKQILGLSSYVFILYKLYNGTFKEKLLTLSIFLSVTFVFELIITLTVVQMFKLDLNNMQDIKITFVYLIYYILLFLFYRFIILIKQKIFSFLKYKNIVAIVSLLCIQYCYYCYLAFSVTMDLERNIFTMYIILFLFILLNGIFVYFMFDMIKQAKTNYTIYLLEQEYQKELEHFLSIKEQDDEIKMLRHDIINYLKKKMD